MKKIFFLFLLLLPSLLKVAGQDSNIDSLRKTFGSNRHKASLKQQLKFAKEDTDKVYLLSNLAWSYVFSYADSSETFARQGLQLAQKIDFKSGEGGCMLLLSISLTDLGDFPNALDFGYKALTIFENLRDTSQRIWANEVLMINYTSQEDYKEAFKYGYEAIRLCNLYHTDSFQLSNVLSSLSSLHEKDNQLDSSLYYAEMAYGYNQHWSGVLQSVGDIRSRMGDFDVALKYYRKGIADATQNQVYVGLVKIYIQMSKVFEAAGKMDSSIYYANKSITQEGIHVYPEGVLDASTQLAHLYESKGVADSIIKYQKLTIALKDSLYSRKKTREVQSFAFNQKLHQQELASQKQQDANKIKTFALLAIITAILIIAFFLWRNNRQKQVVNTLLQKQKEEIQITLSELKSTQAQLIQSEKMASLGELTTGIAHEIQNPLNFVNNFSEVNKELIDELRAEKKKETPDIQNENHILDDIEKNLEKITFHGKRADAIVKGMLQHSRTNTGQKELTDINALADEYMRLGYHGLRAKDKSFNALLQTSFDKGIDKINIVPQDIGRVLLNLYNNAFYAVREKQKLTSGNFEPTVWVSTKKLKDKIEIRIKDNGTGIPQKIMDKIFQPFFTTKPTGQGTGLGLSLSYDIITKVRGGQIKVETMEGEYAEFIILLPS